MLKKNNFLKVILILLCCITIVVGDCLINYGNDPFLKPKLSKRIGRQQINILNTNNYILGNNEEVTASCDIKFKSPQSYVHLSQIIIKCKDNDLYVNQKYLRSDSVAREMLVECASLKWNLYELHEQFVWCPSNMVSYVFARPVNGLASYTNMAGICYDIKNMSAALMHYTMAPRSMNDLHPEALAKYYFTPREEIKDVKETFGTKSITSDVYDGQQFKDWIIFANYQYDSIIQNSFLKTRDFNDLGSLLDSQWWSNLRLGNWKRYENALAKHVENENKAYDIIAGISDAVKAPVKEICQNNYTMKELIDNTNRKIPLYVWNYLQPRSAHNSSDEVVIIAFNSPFFEFYSKEEAIFCKDICNEIDWLKNVRTSFRYSIMGVMFCCSVEEVKSSKRLSGFPEKFKEPTTTALPAIRQPFVYEYQSIQVEENDSNAENED